MRNAYEVLGVAQNADLQEIRRAYRQIILENHPDRNPGDEAAVARFRRAVEAYALLNDPEKRVRLNKSVSPLYSVRDLFARGDGRRVMARYLPRAPMEPRLGEDTFLCVDEPTDGSCVVEVILPGTKNKLTLELPSELVWGESVELGKTGDEPGNLFLYIRRRR